MNTTEIVIREVQGASGFQVVQFLAESVRQARKPAHHHAHGQVLPFNDSDRTNPPFSPDILRSLAL